MWRGGDVAIRSSLGVFEVVADDGTGAVERRLLMIGLCRTTIFEVLKLT